jgi:hypothetical protein
LVADAREWPGVHAIQPLLDGEPVQGHWFDRTQEYAARRRGEEFDRLRYATLYTVTLSPLPCGEELPPEILKKRIAEVVEEIATEAAAWREKAAVPSAGSGQDPPAEPSRASTPNESYRGLRGRRSRKSGRPGRAGAGSRSRSGRRVDINDCAEWRRLARSSVCEKPAKELRRRVAGRL